MAIFHLSVKTFSRSKGQSATASVAYRAGAKIECEREGRTHDYTKKGGVLHSEIFLPSNAPSWANDRQQLWNKAESVEKRKNSTVAREFEVALPYELNKEQRIALVQDFAKQIVERHGCAVDAHLHDDDRRKVKANHHAHIMLTTRKLEADGFTGKTRELDQRQSGEVVYWREQWAKTANEHLRNNGIEKHIDHRSLKEQGLEREPTIKMGISASALERKGIRTDKGDYNRAITAYDPDKINKHLTTQFKQAQELHNKLKFIKRRLPEVKRDIAEKQPRLYKAFDDIGIPTAPDERTIENEQPTQQAGTRLVEPQSPKRTANERVRNISPVSSRQGNELGQEYTEAVRPANNAKAVTALRSKLSNSKALDRTTRQQLELVINMVQDKFTDSPIAQLEKYKTISDKLEYLEQKRITEIEQAQDTLTKYNKLKSEVEQAFEASNVKPLYEKLDQLQRAYETAKKPFLMCKSKWRSIKVEERGKLRQLERQISVTEANNKGKFEQKAKNWIATNKPDREEGYQNALLIIENYNEIRQQQNIQQSEQRVSIVRDKGRDIEL